MLKICPECLNLNVNTETCTTCGYPLNKKVIGRFEEYYFYDAIELFNAGEHQRAKEKITEKQKTDFSNKNALLLDKMQSADSIVSKAESNASLARDYLNRNEFKLAADAVQAAIALFPSARFKELEIQILKALELFQKKEKAQSLSDDAHLLFKNGSHSNALVTLRQAIELDPSNTSYSEAYKKLSDEAVQLWVKESEQLFANKNYDDASAVINQAMQYDATNTDLLQLRQKISTEMNKKKNVRFAVFSVIGVVVLGLAIFGFMAWKKSSDERTGWEYVLNQVAEPAFPVKRCFVPNAITS